MTREVHERNPMHHQPPVFRTNPAGFRRDVQPPQSPLPRGACDTHMHVVGPFERYPMAAVRGLDPGEATLDDYRRMMRVTGLERCVFVQASVHGKDNEGALAASQALGDSARAIVVVDPAIGSDAVAAMHARGARGIRMQRVVAGGAGLDGIERLAARIAEFGWHVQLYIDAEEIPELLPVLRALPVEVVFDHMAQVHDDSGIDTPGFKALLDLMHAGRAWVKLSTGQRPSQRERPLRFISECLERVLWGSDWPHLCWEGPVPHEGKLLDDLNAWAGGDQTLRTILCDNPGKLYFKPA